jgi:hypothetical protein
MLRAMAATALRLVWATDLHLNFLTEPGVRAFARRLGERAPSAVVVTGDTGEAVDVCSLLATLSAHVAAPIAFVLGNHDYYFGSLPEVRTAVRALCETHPRLIWLPDVDAVPLAEDLGLVGVDGWGDARLGDVRGTGVWLNDFRLIAELSHLFRDALITRLNALGDAEAASLAPRLDRALARFETVVIATHVPPFAEACWHEGRISAPDWLPYFTCKAVGDVLLDAADRHPRNHLVVLCGHTHGQGTARLRPNLVVHTGPATYGEPAFRAIDFDALRRRPDTSA